MNETEWLAEFASALKRSDIEGVTSLFAEECYWRDLVAFTWNITTLESRSAIADMLKARLADVQPGSFKAGERNGWFTFETALGRGTGHVRLKDGKAWTLLTALNELKGFEEKRGPSREMGTEHGAIQNRVTWTDRRRADASELGYDRQPFVLIVGGGQGGIGLGARLKRLGVPTLIVDRHPRPGDAWRNRYKSLCLHDPVWYDHLPYLPFPDHWPVYTPKDKMGDWLESYTRIMELDYWSSTPCRSASWDEARREWKVDVEREGKPVTLRPKHLVIATGMSGFPEVPVFPGSDIFRGKQHHSSGHKGGEGWAGKRCVVVGSNNSAHDIAADLVGAEPMRPRWRLAYRAPTRRDRVVGGDQLREDAGEAHHQDHQQSGAAERLLDQEGEHLAGAHHGEAPVVLEAAALERGVVGVASHLEVARRQAGVVADDLRDLEEDVLPFLLQGLAAGVEEDVAGELDHHAVVAHGHLEAELRQGLELLAQELEALLDRLELLGAPAEVLEGAGLLLQVGVEVRDVDAGGLELRLELLDIPLDDRIKMLNPVHPSRILPPVEK